MISIVAYIYEALKQEATFGVVLTTVITVVLLGWRAQHNLNVSSKIILPSLRKVSTKRPEIYKVPGQPADPRMPSQDTPQEYSDTAPYLFRPSEETAKQAIIRTISSLITFGVTDTSISQFYEVICKMNPTRQMTPEFLSAITDNIKGHHGLDWDDFLHKRRVIERYRNRGMSRSPPADRSLSLRRNSHGQGFPIQINGVSPNNNKPGYSKNVSASFLYQPGLLKIKRKGSRTATVIEAPAESKWVSATEDYPAHQAHYDLFGRTITHLYKTYINVDHLGRGAFDPKDARARKRLEARLVEDEDAVVCTTGHPRELELQAWRLIFKDQILRMQLFANPQEICDKIPDRLYITFNALHFLMRAIPKVKDPKDRIPDERIREALLGFSGNLGHAKDAASPPCALVDVEYLAEYLEQEDMDEIHKKYWEIRREWTTKSLRDIGVTTLEDGRYWTAGEEHFYKNGWEMQIPVGMRKRKR